jgi:penicillin-binding protein 2
VVTLGTARVAQIPGIDICAKTGTAENYTVLDDNRIKLPNNSMFVCFAPKENPKIAIAVAVQNAGFGATWAGPIARILMEKYLNDTLQTKSAEDLERISNTNLMPAYLKRLQFKTDSLRAEDWLKRTKDSSYIRKYLSFTAKPVEEAIVESEIADAAIYHAERNEASVNLFAPFIKKQKNRSKTPVNNIPETWLAILPKQKYLPKLQGVLTLA